MQSNCCARQKLYCTSADWPCLQTYWLDLEFPTFNDIPTRGDHIGTFPSRDHTGNSQNFPVSIPGNYKRERNDKMPTIRWRQSCNPTNRKELVRYPPHFQQ